MTHTRRVFFKQSLAGTSAFTALAISGCAHTPATVLETEPQAMALGYSPNGTKTDVKKYPNYVAGRNCSG